MRSDPKLPIGAKAARPAKPDAIAMLAALNGPNGQMMKPRTAAASGSVKTRQTKPGARAGTRQIAGHFPEATVKALKFVMAEEATTLQALLDEAIHDLLVKKGRAKMRQ